MPYKLIGRTTKFEGKRLWEIIGHLKNFGAGRMLVRTNYERHYSEPTFYSIVVAHPDMDTGRPNMDEDNMRGKVLVERVFRGRHEGVVDISKAAYKPDFRLIHKHEEAKYIEAYKKCKPPPVKVYPPYRDMPPLLKLVAERDGHSTTLLKVTQNKSSKTWRVAEEGEKPTHYFENGLGTPANPKLYEGVI